MTDLADLLREAGAHDATFTADDVEARVRGRRRRRRVGSAMAAALIVAAGIGAFAIATDEDGTTTVAGPPSAARVDMTIEHRIQSGEDGHFSVLLDGRVAYLIGGAEMWSALVEHDLRTGEQLTTLTGPDDYPKMHSLRGSGPALAWVSEPFDPRDGSPDRPWRIEVLIGGERRTIAESERDGYVSFVLSWPWIAWMGGPQAETWSEISVMDLRSNATYVLPAENSSLVAIDGDVMWLRRDDEILRQPIDGSSPAEVVIATTNLRDIAVADGIVAWMTEAPGGRGARTLHVRGHDGITRSVTSHQTRITWGLPSVVGDVLAWDEPEDGFVAAPVVDPRQVTRLAQREYSTGWRGDTEGDRVVWSELNDDGRTYTIYVARLRVEAAPAEK